jgi:hypothetical protein
VSTVKAAHRPFLTPVKVIDLNNLTLARQENFILIAALNLLTIHNYIKKHIYGHLSVQIGPGFAYWLVKLKEGELPR